MTPRFKRHFASTAYVFTFALISIYSVTKMLGVDEIQKALIEVGVDVIREMGRDPESRKMMFTELSKIFSDNNAEFTDEMKAAIEDIKRDVVSIKEAVSIIKIDFNGYKEIAKRHEENIKSNTVRIYRLESKE